MIPTIQQGGNEVNWALAWSPDGQSLVVGEVIYDVEAGREITSYSPGGELRALAWSANGKRLAVNTATRKVLYKPPYGALRIFDASIGREIANYQEGSVIPAYNPLHLNPRTMAWASDGKNLLLVQDSIDIWKMD
jgi:YD repeat-containing protein